MTSDAQVTIEAERAAEMAVKKTFAILGVDVNNPESIEAFRQDLRFGGKLRRAADRSALAFWGTVGAVLAYAMFVGLDDAVKRTLL